MSENEDSSAELDEFGWPTGNIKHEGPDFPLPDPEESNLVFHARRELTLIGEEPDTIEGYLKVIQAFADMGHSGGSASVAIPTIERLLRYENLKPLTDDPDEWICHSEEVWGRPGGVWQSNRNSEAFSNDAGQTYYLLSEIKRGSHPDGKNRILHRSEHSPNGTYLKGLMDEVNARKLTYEKEVNARNLTQE